MKTIDELMKGQIPGSLILTRDGYIFTPYFRNDRDSWVGTNQYNETVYYSGCVGMWTIHQEPIEMEDRWQWATEDGRWITAGFHTKPPVGVTSGTTYTLKLTYTKTQFPKGD